MISFKNGIIPAIIQDITTNRVLMMGYMNKESYKKSIYENKVTFYSRSKKKLWTKGETSGNYLFIKKIFIDCDKDTLLIKVDPIGPVCHTGYDTCWKETNKENFLFILEKIIYNRINDKAHNSYIYKLFIKGINRISQKLGEESIELIIESKDSNNKYLLNEAADLLFHYLILLNYKKLYIKDVLNILEKRHIKKQND